MNDAKFAQQLLSELPALVEQNILPADCAAALRKHYAPLIQAPRSLSIGLTISAILGGLLVGAGIILLLAHNWDGFSRPVRAGISIAPLLVSIALAAFTLLRRTASAAWREGTGAFYFLSIGASIALVSQTYHLYNDLAGFLLVWLALTVPLVYLLGVGTAFAGFLACLVGYNFVANEGWNTPLNFAPLAWLAAAAPFFIRLVWKRRDSLMVTWLAAALSVSGILLPLAYNKSDFWYWPLLYAGLFTLYYLVACRWFGDLRGWRNPFRVLGCLGIAVIALTLTFEFLGHVKLSHELLTWCFLAGWLALTVSLARRNLSFNWAAALFPGAVILSGFILGPLLMSLYVLILGVFTLVRGVKRDSLLSMNEGMLLLMALTVSQFFNDDWGFIARGVAFITVGIGFLGMNIWVLVKRKNNKDFSA